MSSHNEKKSSIQRFKSFEEASQVLDQAGFEGEFDARRVQQFLAMTTLPHRIKPGLRRFDSFEEAQRAAIQDSIESSVR